LADQTQHNEIGQAVPLAENTRYRFLDRVSHWEIF
jgi:hypothetical protein